MSKTWIRWIPAILWMGVIFYLSHQPADNLNSMLPFFHRFFPWMQGFDWGHFVVYFVLALTYYFALGKKFTHLKGKLLVIGLCFAYGLTDEFHQQFVEGRHPDWIDIRNDTIGATLAMIMMSIPLCHRLYMKLFYTKNY